MVIGSCEELSSSNLGQSFTDISILSWKLILVSLGRVLRVSESLWNGWGRGDPSPMDWFGWSTRTGRDSDLAGAVGSVSRSFLLAAQALIFTGFGLQQKQPERK